VILFGPTDPGRHLFGPAERPIHVPMDCAPCHDHGPKRCPLGHHRCMADLEVGRVAEAVRSLLGEGPGPAARAGPAARTAPGAGDPPGTPTTEAA
jgi:hypothetical protein